MSDCSEIGLMLGAAGDGELEPDHLQEVAGHLTGCTSCAGTLSDYSRIGSELRTVAVVPSLDGFTKSVLALIAKLGVAAIVVVALHSAILGTRTTEIAPTVPAAVAGKPATTGVVTPDRLVEVQVDSATVSDRAFGAFSHSNGRAQSGRLMVFTLPGGRTLHVMPRAIDGGRIAMQVVLFDGSQPAMTANLTLDSGDTFALSGEQFGETLLLRISPTTTAPRGPSYSQRSPDVGTHRAS